MAFNDEYMCPKIRANRVNGFEELAATLLLLILCCDWFEAFDFISIEKMLVFDRF